jgi:hypothetical protein
MIMRLINGPLIFVVGTILMFSSESGQSQFVGSGFVMFGIYYTFRPLLKSNKLVHYKNISDAIGKSKVRSFYVGKSYFRLLLENNKVAYLSKRDVKKEELNFLISMDRT